MELALIAWLQPSKASLENGSEIVDKANFRKNKALLLKAAEIKEWPYNGLRHSFGSYHLAMFRSAKDTSHQMGNSEDMVHKHYKALVTKAEAEKFWNLRPEKQASTPQSAQPQPSIVTTKTESSEPTQDSDIRNDVAKSQSSTND
jgi:hypothetical protein